MSNKIFSNYQSVQEKVTLACKRAGRSADSVKIVAVSKRQAIPKIQELVSTVDGVFLGENFVQEFEEKSQELSGNYQSHLIGALQSNKVKKAVALFDVIESVAKEKTLRIVNKEAEKINKIQNIFLQVNISEDENKAGFLAHELPDILSAIPDLKNLNLQGLMTITRYYENKEDARPDFQAMQALRENLHKEFPSFDLKLSMGMSADFEIAIEEGADFVRVGTAIFGERI